jgi:hypothetical protein
VVFRRFSAAPFTADETIDFYEIGQRCLVPFKRSTR